LLVPTELKWLHRFRLYVPGLSRNHKSLLHHRESPHPTV
jgi:hypothetical protein